MKRARFFVKAHPDEYDKDVAAWVLRGSMIGELNLFASACGQSLTAMPVIRET